MERSLSCAECVGFFLSHPINILQQIAVARKQKPIWFRYQQNTCTVTWILNQKLRQTSNLFHCFSRESFLETKSHSWINKRWSESSLSRGWFAGQEFKFSCLNEAACSLLEHCEAAPVPLRVAPTGLGDRSCHQGWDGIAWLRVQLWKSDPQCSSSISCKKDAQVLLFFATALIKPRKVGFFSSFLPCFFSSWLVDTEKSLCEGRAGRQHKLDTYGCKVCCCNPAGRAFGLGFFPSRVVWRRY